MFDIGSWEILIIAIVVLLVVGPKDLPGFLRTIGKYVGALKKQANEFRAHLDEAIRETELDQLRKDVSDLKNEVSDTVRSATRDIERDVAKAETSLRETVDEVRASPTPKPAADEDAASGGPPRQDDPLAPTESGGHRRRNIGSPLADGETETAPEALTNGATTDTAGKVNGATEMVGEDHASAVRQTPAAPPPTQDPLAASQPSPQRENAPAVAKTDA